VGVCATYPTTEAARMALSPTDDPLLKAHLLVTWYGEPNSPRMGVLGRYTGAELADGLRKQVSAYQGLTPKTVIAGWQPVVKVRRCTEAGDAPGWQGVTSENIGNI
jgi:hypothetical protein